MKIRLLKCVLILGTPTDPGTVVDLAAVDATSLIRRGMATPEGADAEKASTFLQQKGVISTESGLVQLQKEPEPKPPTKPGKKR